MKYPYNPEIERSIRKHERKQQLQEAILLFAVAIVAIVAFIFITVIVGPAWNDATMPAEYTQ